MKKAMEKLEALLELGGTKKDIVFLILSGLALLVSIFRLLPLPFDAAWVAIILCGIPIILEAVIGLVTAFDIKADVLVSLALTAIMAAIGNATKHGFLVREGDALERLAKVTTVTFDKTGTLTYGVPEVVRSRSVSPALSHRMMTTIKLNMTFSMTLNFLAITLAIIGTLNPVVGALVHNAGSVLVITNSALLLNWRKKQ